MKHSKNDYISDMKFSPTLSGSANHMLKKHNKHTGIKLASLLFALLTLLVNVATFSGSLDGVSSLSSSTNDIFYGGLGVNETHARQTLLQSYDNNQNIGGNQETDIKDLMNYFGVARIDIQSSTKESVCVGCESSSEIRVVSREESSLTSSDKSDIVISGKQLPTEPISDFYKESNLDVLKLNNTTWVELRSGNIIFQPESKLSLEQKFIDDSGAVVDSTEVEPSNIRQRIFISNTGKTKVNNVGLSYPTPRGSKVIDYSSSLKPDDGQVSDNLVELSWDSLDASQTEFYIDILFTSASSSFCTETNLTSLETNKETNAECFVFKQISSPPLSIDTDTVERAPETVETGYRVDRSVAVESIDGKTLNEVSASDVIVYRLSFSNTTDEPIDNYELPEFDANDILEYSNLSDINDGEIEKGLITWGRLNFEPNQTIEKEIEFRVLDVLPETASNSTDPSSYDCVLSVTYGNTSNTPVKCGPIKVVEQSSSSLPTVTSTSLVYVSAAIFTVSLAFYAISVINGHRLHKARQEWL